MAQPIPVWSGTVDKSGPLRLDARRAERQEMDRLEAERDLVVLK